MKKGFTLVELLVVVGIIAVMMGILMTGFGKAPQKAEIAKCSELVKNTETALAALFEQNGAWPKCLINNNNSSRGLDETAAYPLASQIGMSLSYDTGMKKLKGLDKFGIVTPWAAAVIKNRGESCSESDRVPIGGTIAVHRLCYAIDLDGDGVIKNVNPGATVPDLKGSDRKSVSIRSTAAVWCRGPKGVLIKSWTDGQTKDVN